MSPMELTYLSILSPFPPYPNHINSLLTQANLPFAIFEHETSTTYQSRPREWGMTLHWGSTHVNNCLPPELSARFSEAYADPSLSLDATTGLPVHNGKTGELILEMVGEKPMRVSRKKMRNLFMEGIDVQFGKSVETCGVIDDEKDENKGRVRVRFADGTDAVGDVVVGCDGAKSVVRQSIVGIDAAQLTDVPMSMFNFTQKFPAEFSKDLRSRNPLFITSIHPDHGTFFWLSSEATLIIIPLPRPA